MTPEEETTAAQEILTPERLAVLLLDNQAPETWHELLAAVNARVQTQAEDLSERTWQPALEQMGVLKALLCLGLALYKHREGRARSPGAYLYGLVRRLRWARKERWITRWRTARCTNSRGNERRRILRAMRNAAGNAPWSASNKQLKTGRAECAAALETRFSAAEVEEVSSGGRGPGGLDEASVVLYVCRRRPVWAGTETHPRMRLLVVLLLPPLKD